MDSPPSTPSPSSRKISKKKTLENTPLGEEAPPRAPERTPSFKEKVSQGIASWPWWRTLPETPPQTPPTCRTPPKTTQPPLKGGNSPKTPQKTPSKGSPSRRNSPEAKTLGANGIEIFGDDKVKAHDPWPNCVSSLSSHLIGSFSHLVSEKMKSKHSWGEIPGDAYTCPNTRNLREKDRRVECALNIKERCENLVERGTVQEHAWNRIWWDTFEKHALAERLGNHEMVTRSCNKLAQVCDAQYKTEVMRDDVPGCLLTRPKPDATLVFTALASCACGSKKIAGATSSGLETCKCFTKEVLKKLQKTKVSQPCLQPSSFSEAEGVCFPWAIFEGKSSATKSPLSPECQAANAAVVCLGILENLEKEPGKPQQYQRQRGDENGIVPIPCFTCRGEEWKLWICYRSDRDFPRKTYDFVQIFKGSMNDLWSCLQLLCIVERLREWALKTLKPQIEKHLAKWVMSSNGRSPLSSYEKTRDSQTNSRPSLTEVARSGKSAGYGQGSYFPPSPLAEKGVRSHRSVSSVAKPGENQRWYDLKGVSKQLSFIEAAKNNSQDRSTLENSLSLSKTRPTVGEEDEWDAGEEEEDDEDSEEEEEEEESDEDNEEEEEEEEEEVRVNLREEILMGNKQGNLGQPNFPETKLTTDTGWLRRENRSTRNRTVNYKE